MIVLLQNAQVYAPRYLGRKDIWLVGDKILRVTAPGEYPAGHPLVEIISCDGLTAFPGVIDTHVHITGGGGEQGPASRIPEICAREILQAGVTTICGLLGADRQTRSLKSLLAKAKALECEGISTFIYAGSYEVPPVTFTGDIAEDLLLIDKVIGIGEIAISDYRSSHPSVSDITRIASAAHLGGMISAKAGLTVLHVGDGRAGMLILDRILRSSDLPVKTLLPTHVNRNRELLMQAVRYAKSGGNIDLTSGEKAGIPVAQAIKILLRKGVSSERITISSDAGGSSPDGSVCEISALYEDIISAIRIGIPTELVFSMVTQNAAERIGQSAKKGCIEPGADADILLLDSEYNIQKVIAMGKEM